MIGEITNNVSVTTNVNGYLTNTLYQISYYLPELGERLQRDFVYCNILSTIGAGVLLKVRVGGYYREVDFKACSIQNKNKIDTDNTKFFMKGVYRRDTDDFRDMKVGSDYVTCLTQSSLDSLLPKVISDYVRSICLQHK